MYSENYHPDSARCPHCGVPLSVSSDSVNHTGTLCIICKNEIQDSESCSTTQFVTVYIPKNESEHLAAQALLKSANIEFFSKNFTVQNLFGAGQIGTGFNIVTGPIQLQVPEEDAEEARELLEDYFSATPIDALSGETDWLDNRYFSAQKAVDKMTTRAMIFSIFWFGGIGASIAIYYALKSLRLIREAEEPLMGKARSLIALGLASVEVIISPYLWVQILYEWNMLL